MRTGPNRTGVAPHHVGSSVFSIWRTLLLAVVLLATQAGGIFAQVPNPCTPTTSLNISTGWDPVAGALQATGTLTSYWQIIAAPPGWSLGPANVIPPWPGWAAALPGTRWIGPNANGSSNNTGTYVYEYCFCLLPGFQNPQLNLNVMGDDNARVFVNGNAFPGNVTNTPGSVPWKTPTAMTDNNPAHFVVGRNCITVHVTNSGSVATGLDISGTVTTTNAAIAPQNPECCKPNGIITGVKFNDLNCNGVRDAGEPTLPNWTITLTNGLTTWTTTTNGSGTYSFNNLFPGTYTVSEVNQVGWTQTHPVGGTHTVVLGPNGVAAGRNFGNCKPQGCFTLVNQTITCKYTPTGYQYIWCFRVKNDSWFPATYLTLYAPGGVTFIPSGLTTQTITLTPTLPPNATSATTYCVTLQGAAPFSTLSFIGVLCDLQRINCCHKAVSIAIPGPCPPPNCCVSFTKFIYNVTSTPSPNGNVALNGLATALGPGSANIIGASVTVVSASINSQPVYGYFTGSNFPALYNAGYISGYPYPTDVSWGPFTPVTVNGAPFTLNLKFPPLGGGIFAKDTLRWCLRFRFTDANCKTCETVLCFTKIRTKIIHSGGGVLNGSFDFNTATLSVNLPSPPQGYAITYTGLTIESALSTVTIVDATAPPRLPTYTADGVVSSQFLLEPGSTIDYTLTYDGLGTETSVPNRVTFQYLLTDSTDGSDTIPTDTVYDEVIFEARSNPFGGSDEVNSTETGLSKVQTYAIHLRNANLNESNVTQLVLDAPDGLTIVAVGPTASNSRATLDFGVSEAGTSYVGEHIGDARITLTPGAELKPIYLTVAGTVEPALSFRTIDAYGHAITQGEVTLSNPATGAMTSGAPDEGIMLEEATTGGTTMRSVPNPSSLSTTIQLTLAQPLGNAMLVVTDANGREVLRLIDGESLSQGEHAVFVNTASLPSGTYYYTLRADGLNETRVMQIVR